MPKKIHWQSPTDQNESLTDQYHVTKSKKSQHEQEEEPTLTHDLAATQLVTKLLSAPSQTAPELGFPVTKH